MEKKTKATKATNSYKKHSALTLKQLAFLECFEKSLGNITDSAKIAKINRVTYYKWLQTPNFKKAIEEIDVPSVFDDFILKNAYKRVQEGSDVIIKELLSKRAKRLKIYDDDKQENTGTTIQVFINEEEKQ